MVKGFAEIGTVSDRQLCCGLLALFASDKATQSNPGRAWKTHRFALAIAEVHVIGDAFVCALTLRATVHPPHVLALEVTPDSKAQLCSDPLIVTRKQQWRVPRYHVTTSDWVVVPASKSRGSSTTVSTSAASVAVKLTAPSV